MLGSSWLGLLWWVLEAGPSAEHPGVVAALETVRDGCVAVVDPSLEQRRAALAEALGALVDTEREPLASLDLSLRLASRPGACGQCGDDVPAGLVGWYAGSEAGPLCRCCLQDNAPSLAVLLDAVIFGLPDALAAHGLPGPPREGGGGESLFWLQAEGSAGTIARPGSES